jgi:hypothetical protein
MSQIHNERTKLTANWLDRAGTAALTLGVFAPLAARFFGYPGHFIPLEALILAVGFWLSLGVPYLWLQGLCWDG